MFCTNCGVSIDEKAVVCPHCGAATKNYSSSEIVKTEKKGNPMAIAGFVCAFFFWLFGLVFGCMGLRRSKQIGGEGRGLSIAAIIISLIPIASLVVLLFGVEVLGW